MVNTHGGAHRGTTDHWEAASMHGMFGIESSLLGLECAYVVCSGVWAEWISESQPG